MYVYHHSIIKHRVVIGGLVLGLLCLLYLLKMVLKRDVPNLPFQAETDATTLMEFYCSNGARVVFKTLPPTSVGWAVLVHGLDSSFASWQTVVPWLLELGYGVLLVDLPNHGLARAPNTPPTTIDHMVNALDELLQALGIASPTFVAHSMGALVTLKLHARLRARGDAPAKSYLLNPVLRVPPAYALVLKSLLPAYRLLQTLPHDQRTNHVDYSKYFDKSNDSRIRTLTRLFTVKSVTWEQFEACLREMMNTDVNAVLGEAFLASTVVLYGTEDSLQEETARFFHGNVQALYRVPGHDHNVYTLGKDFLDALKETVAVDSPRHEFQDTFARQRELGLGYGGVCWQK